MTSVGSVPPFESSLFVGSQRASVVNQLHQWLAHPSPRYRIQSVTGAPGMGKTWVLEKIRSDLSAGDVDPTGSPLVLTWIDVPRMVTPAPAARGFPTLNLTYVQPWFEELHARSSSACPGRIGDYRRDAEPSAWIDGLARDICPVAGARLVILVDGHDDVDRDSARLFDQRVLVEFIRQPCTRIIVARRGDLLLSSYHLNAMENRVELGPEPMADDQGRTLLNLPPDKLVRLLDALKRCVPEYGWNHPFINHWLLIWASEYGQPNPCEKLNKDVLVECAHELFAHNNAPYNRGASASWFPRPFDLLFDIATQMRPQWTGTELTDTLGVKGADPAIQQLGARGLLEMDQNNQRYAVVGGVRELLRAIQALRQGGR